MYIKVTTPLGVFTSDTLNYEKDSLEYANAKRLLSGVCEDGAYFSMKTEIGELFLPKNLIQQSVFELIH